MTSEVVQEFKETFTAYQTEHLARIKALEDKFELLDKKSGRPRATSLGGSEEGTPERKALDTLVHFVRTGGFLETKAMSIGSSPDGGYEVPPELDKQMQVQAANESTILQVSRRVEGVTDAYVQNISQGLPASAWIPEGGTRAATATPQIAQIAFTRGGLYAVASVTQWLLDDATHDLGNWLIGELGRSFGSSIGAALAIGDGVNKPKGVASYTHAATADGTRPFGQVQYTPTGTAGVVNLDACLTALYTLHPAYQKNAAWVMAPSAVQALRSQKATTAGSFLWDPDSKAGQPPTLFGLPVFVDVSLPVVAAGSKSIYLADWQRAYTTVFYGRPLLIRDNITQKGNVQLYSERRVGGGITDSNAIKCVQASAT